MHRVSTVIPPTRINDTSGLREHRQLEMWRLRRLHGHGCQSPAAADITTDQATMSHLQSGNFLEEANKKERNRICKSPEL